MAQRLNTLKTWRDRKLEHASKAWDCSFGQYAAATKWCRLDPARRVGPLNPSYARWTAGRQSLFTARSVTDELAASASAGLS